MMLNRNLLGICISIVVTLIFYFFYWNRFIAFVIGQTIRILFWNQEGPIIWIDIGSIHFSLLAGRILLKDVRYHSSNQTIKVVKGQIQWRYWIRQPTSEEEINPARGENGKQSFWLWSCRIQLTFEGVEWFLYNRTAAFDSILEQIEKASRPRSRSSSHHRLFRRFSRQGDASLLYPPSAIRASSVHVPNSVKQAFNWVRGQLPTLDPKELLPLGIDIRTGAIILGNSSTPNLLVSEFQTASGTFGIVPSRSKYDLYKQVLNLKFRKPSMRLVNNDDYVDSMVMIGSLVHGRLKHQSTMRKPYFYQPYRAFMKIWRQMKLYSIIDDYFSTRRLQRVNRLPLRPSATPPKLKKLAEEDTPVGIDFSMFEYAIERKILEAPILELTYYVDVVGEVPSRPTTVQSEDSGVYDIHTGDPSPEWGFDVIIHGGVIRYGPWADRQRIELQRAFFPPTHLDSIVTPILKPGEKRLWINLQVFIELRDATTLYVPFREASKDWQWDGKVDIPQRPRVRESASIMMDVGDRSSINYIVPMVVGPSGYESTFEVHLDTISLTSTLNDIHIMTAESCRVRGELPSPISWDSLRTWSIAVHLRQPVLFILRDHINMFTDLAKDWVSGPPTEYQKFIPIIYAFRLELYHFQLNLYANDQNIVDKPLIKEENALLSFSGPHLKNVVTVPANTFRPESTSIPFFIAAPNIVVKFSLPRWNTHAHFAPKEGLDLFKAPLLNISGSYLFFSSVMEDHVEQLKLHFELQGAVFKAYGWSIRYLMVLRDNYLGSFTHFQTLSEYLDKREKHAPVGDPVAQKYRAGKHNMLQVELSLRADDSDVLLPFPVLGDATQKSSNYLTFQVPEIQLQLRLHDHYMEMSLNLETITGMVPPAQASSDHGAAHRIVVVDGIDITAHRLFGPQPGTATYICIWEIAVGKVKAYLTANDANLLAAAASSFRLNFIDVVNAPATDFLPVVDPDVTFYKVTVKPIELTWKSGHAALFVQLSNGLHFDNNDLGAHQYRSMASLKIPQINVSVLLASSTEKKNQWLEAANVLFDMNLDIYSLPLGHRVESRKQLTFIEEQDTSTGRAKFMFNQLRQHIKRNNPSDQPFHRSGIFLPRPSLPDAFIYPSTSVPPLQSQTHRSRPPSWRLSTLTNLSDSEEEEGISEADRDARLAKTRTSTPAPDSRADDVTMSSGDESDNADLTDGDSTGDIWSDLEDTDDQGTASMLTFYSPIVRHYCSNWSRLSSTWDETAFRLTRNCSSFWRNLSESDNEASQTNNTRNTIPELPKDRDTTTFRIKSRKNVDISFTPLLVAAVGCFAEDMKSITSSYGMVIDSLLVNCLGSAKKPTLLGCQALDLDISSVTICALQHIGISDEAILDRNRARETITPRNLDITAILKLGLRDFHVAGIFGGQLKPNINARIARVTTTLDVSIDKRTLDSTDPTIVNLSLSSSVVKLSQHKMQTNLGIIDSTLGNRGPEIITSAATALTFSGMHILRLADNLKLHRLSRTRTVIGNLLKVTEKHPVIDPLSIIQPSYLVQSGAPHVLRTDATFRFLYHLRNTLRGMKEEEQARLCQNSSGIQLSELLNLVESRLGLLEQETGSIDQLSSINYLLSDEARPLHQPKYYYTEAMSLQVGTSTLTILAPTGKMSSRLNIDNLVLDIQPKSLHLIQFNFNNSSSASQTSLRSKASKTVRRTSLLFSLNEITLVVSPHLMYFAQHVLRVTRNFQSSQVITPVPKYGRGNFDKSSNHSSKVWLLDVIGTVRRLRIQAGAENLILVMGIQGLQTSSSMLAFNKRAVQSMNHSVIFNEIYFQARSPADPSKESDQDILAALAFNSGRISVVAEPETDANDNFKLVFALADLQLYVPRSALRLYHFVGEWRADYLPGMEAAVNTLLSEYNAGPFGASSPPASRLSSQRPRVQIHGQITHFEISLQVMHGTWLSWEVVKTVAYLDSSAAKKDGSHYAFGLQIASMIFSISSKPNAKDAMPSSRVKLVLPPVSLAGNSDGFNVHTLVLFEYMELKVKPSHWDTLLSVQQKFGQDFNDLVALMQQTRQKVEVSSSTKVMDQRTRLQYEAHLKMQGFRIGLEGVNSTVLLECQDIIGEISNAKGWSGGVNLTDLALSLAPRARSFSDATFNRGQRSAFVIIDFKFNGSGSYLDNAKTLALSVSKVHAVMQPSSIGELGDFIDNLQVEMLERQDQRSLELATFKEKAQSILKTFDVNIGDVQAENDSWIHTLVVAISIQSVGVAFPLTYDEELSFVHPVRKGSAPIRAFLFSIKSIEFGIHRGESGQAVMQHLSFQFISRFRQSVPEDFSAESHHTCNHLLYPRMTAQLRSTYTGTSTNIWVDADVSGFIFDIDSTIPKFIFSLIDVYRQGKERVERLSANIPRTPLSSTSLTAGNKLSIPEKNTKTIPTSNISASLVFHSGKVRLYSASASNLLKTKTTSMAHPFELSDEHISELGAEIFSLPIVSVWAEYRATSGSQKSARGCETEPSVLIFNSTVHSSNNTLRPILLPFLTEVVDHIESRLRKVSLRTSRHPSVLLPLSSSNDSLPRIEQDEDSFSSLQICFSLRIDKSKLELTCQPDVNVIAGLHWESGGFVVNMTPGARKISFFGSVGGLTVGLKHGFLSEDCVKLDARDLAFSVSLQRLELGLGHSISIILDTEFLGGVRFSRLQDILCFKAVWLDRIPLFNQTPLDDKGPTSLRHTNDGITDTSSLQGRMSTIVLVRIRKIKLEVDLGQSISKIGLELADSVLRMKLTDDLNDVFLFISDVSLNAQGNLSGHAKVTSCVFQTIRRSEGGLWNDHGRGQMLELKLTSGPLVIDLESDHQKLLHYRAQPLGVEVYDDWSKIHPHATETSRPLQLSFTVTCPEIVAAVTVGTIPKLLSHANKFKANLDVQRQGAFRESQTFRATRAPKPHNPLSTVAEAMLHSARTRFKETDTGLSYIIRQHMSLQLDVLRLIVFPRTMRDMEIAQFIARDVAARLNGLVGTDMTPGSRDLVLSFSSMVISRYTQVNHSTHIDLNPTHGQLESEWPNSLFKDAVEATIVGLPSMKMHMISDETTDEAGKILAYDFYSQFVRRAGMKAFEDIYITLNMSLYSWLTILRKNLTRELDQVRATEDWRTSISNVSPAIVPAGPTRKKKAPDPLSLVESPRSATLPTAGTAGLSPYAPPSARQSWLDHNRSPQSAREQSLSAAASPLHSASTTMPFPTAKETAEDIGTSQTRIKRPTITYKPRERHIERLTMRQLGEATPDVMHPFFMKKAGFNLEDSLPQYVNEYAIVPLEEIMEVLLKLYSQQLLTGTKKPRFADD